MRNVLWKLSAYLINWIGPIHFRMKQMFIVVCRFHDHMDEMKRLGSWWSIVGYKYLYVTNRRKKIHYRNLLIVANFTVETHFRFEKYNWHVTFSTLYIYWFNFLSYLFYLSYLGFKLFVKNKRYNWMNHDNTMNYLWTLQKSFKAFSLIRLYKNVQTVKHILQFRRARPPQQVFNKRFH